MPVNTITISPTETDALLNGVELAETDPASSVAGAGTTKFSDEGRGFDLKIGLPTTTANSDGIQSDIVHVVLEGSQEFYKPQAKTDAKQVLGTFVGIEPNIDTYKDDYDVKVFEMANNISANWAWKYVTANNFDSIHGFYVASGFGLSQQRAYISQYGACQQDSKSNDPECQDISRYTSTLSLNPKPISIGLYGGKHGIQNEFIPLLSASWTIESDNVWGLFGEDFSWGNTADTFWNNHKLSMAYTGDVPFVDWDRVNTKVSGSYLINTNELGNKDDNSNGYSTEVSLTFGLGNNFSADAVQSAIQFAAGFKSDFDSVEDIGLENADGQTISFRTIYGRHIKSWIKDETKKGAPDLLSVTNKMSKYNFLVGAQGSWTPKNGYLGANGTVTGNTEHAFDCDYYNTSGVDCATDKERAGEEATASSEVFVEANYQINSRENSLFHSMAIYGRVSAGVAYNYQNEIGVHEDGWQGTAGCFLGIRGKI